MESQRRMFNASVQTDDPDTCINMDDPDTSTQADDPDATLIEEDVVIKGTKDTNEK